MIRNLGCQSGWKRFFAGSKKLPSHPCLCLGRQKQIKSYRRLFHSSLLSVCWPSAPVLTDPQRSFHGAPGPRISSQTGERKRFASWGRLTKQELLVWPKEQPQNIHLFIRGDRSSVESGPWHVPSSWVPLLICAGAANTTWLLRLCFTSNLPNIKAFPSSWERIRRGEMNLEQRGLTASGSLWNSKYSKYHGAVKTIKVWRRNSIMLTVLQAASSAATFLDKFMWISSFFADWTWSRNITLRSRNSQNISKFLRNCKDFLVTHVPISLSGGQKVATSVRAQRVSLLKAC